ncbi:cytochrome P450 [Pararhodobacter sp. CCB-MM2]|uniref:bifunctional cytochrome P450/NADPH--P450 reductase n=1 Tax=Pararhodobacter sp. CCB-MM2 TaxID=1786003 RepID=UPI00082F089D|nr:cytochrome P450 [Pararhodobacter sp. CCB-MM2]
MSAKIVVPQPPVKPIIGNLPQIDKDRPVQSMMALAEEYGPFFKMQILNKEIYLASSQELVDELCDETLYAKRVHTPLQEIRAFAKDGLFTAHNDEPNWARAHNILMPAFGPIGVRDMFPQMLDIADQMFTRWERFGGGTVVDVADNMTRLTLDTIALAGFDYRFNSFYRDEMHPFVGAMVGALKESGLRGRRPAIVSKMMRKRAKQYEADIELLKKVGAELIAERRADPNAATKDDLLNRMLNGRDPKTGEGLSDENIMYQMITFLIAGHETTSGLLSFATLLMLQNPAVLAEARAQVDRVLGDRMPTLQDLNDLRYLDQVLMETLRLWPTAPAFGRFPHKDTLLGGKYPLTPKDTVLVLIPTLHRDPAVWPEPEAFRPERFAQDAAAQLPPNAWKPFGTGARACIGRPFAMQEAQLVLAMMLQRFDFELADPDYKLVVHETLTLKPEDLRIRITPRRARAALQTAAAPVARKAAAPAPVAKIAADATPLTVVFGSNTGSAEGFARRIADEAPAHGFAPRLMPMDDLTGALPTEGALVVVTASYEGQPPDNAVTFVPHVEALGTDAVAGLKTAVFGCGNRQWARTWQAIPTRVDQALTKAGAESLLPRGEGDSGGDFFGTFEDWIADLWPALAKAFGKEAVTAAPPALSVEFVEGQRETLLHLGELQPGAVIENRELVDMSGEGARSKRHIEIRLPEGMRYKAGDYLAVLARNPEALVDRALRRFGLTADRLIVLHREGAGSSLPLDYPVAVGEVFGAYVELAQPASRAQVTRLAALTRCPPEKAALEALAAGDYEAEVLGKRLSVLDLLTRFESTPLDLAEFLSMLPAMRARQYSISSSPLWKPDHVTLTVAVVDAPAASGLGQYRGVASTHLAALQPGDRVAVAVRPSAPRFHPPAEAALPMVMICAGSGLAPFRGFLQERAMRKAAGETVGKALLYFGTNDPAVDYLYEDELKGWEAQGIVELRPVFTNRPENDWRFVQHRLWDERDEVATMFGEGALFFTCGDGKFMAPAVRDTLVRIVEEKSGLKGDDILAWVARVEHDEGRYTADVFA